MAMVRVGMGQYRDTLKPNAGIITPKGGMIPVKKPVAAKPLAPVGAAPAAGQQPATGTVPSTGGPLTAVNGNGAPITNLKPMQDQRAQLVKEVQRRGGRAGAPGFAKQLDALDAKIGAARNANNTAPAPTPEPAPAPAAPVDNIQSNDPGAAAGLFPDQRIFEPQNYEGSPLYQFQKGEGERALAMSLAKRGLSNSGQGIREELNLPLRLAAQDTERMTDVANNNANRLMTIQNNEADRLLRKEENQWGRIYDTASLMADQSPWQAALQGLGAVGDLTKESGNSVVNFLKDYYKRSVGGGGGGGGAPAQIPIPSGPNYSNISPAQISNDYSSSNGWLNLLTKGLANLF